MNLWYKDSKIHMSVLHKTIPMCTVGSYFLQSQIVCFLRVIYKEVAGWMRCLFQFIVWQQMNGDTARVTAIEDWLAICFCCGM
jgi:hypothetical protein